MAANVDATKRAGDIKTGIFGVSKKGWKIVEAPENSDAENAIDELESTNWSTLKGSSESKLPVEVVIDMGKTHTINAFTYLPRQDKKKEGLIDRYAYYVSENGRDWIKAREGDFHNIEANPVQQLVLPNTPLKARYFKFSALHVNAGPGVSVAELGVMTR